ncbi:carbohydrate ABC transporter permease [Butyrivibrio sp. MC2013]|uniref:carbohydrate ABC transporter permease n=1 Tax=Butyrivibrio sp. MC2013 TaxID=1280686 RepID=UPI000423D84D|nr:carbohydrate ABC transporter permease [Butyrivibrio sp. MC2013]
MKDMKINNRKRPVFFNKYAEKKDGVIRSYDIKSPSVRAWAIIITLICFFMAIVSLFPALWLFLASFKDIKEFTREVSIIPKEFDWERMAATWKAFKFTKFYTNSLIHVLGAMVCAVLFNGLLAYGFAILKPRGYGIPLALVLWSMMIPGTAGIVALFRNINNVGLNHSFVPLWFAYGANAFYVILFKQFFEELPGELLEAARLDGCGIFRIFTDIVLPLSRPIIMVVAIFAITGAWSDFLLPYLVLNGTDKTTVMVKLFSFKDTPTDAVSVLRASFFAIIPPTIIFALFQKQITDSAATGAVKG